MGETSFNSPLSSASPGVGDRCFRTVFEKSPLGVAIASLDGRWLYFNEQFRAITGYEQEELLGLSFQQITHPQDLPQTSDRISQLMAGQMDGFCQEKRYLRKDGATVWVQATISLARDAGGEPDYLIGMVQDITPRKTTELALRDSQSRLELALEAAHMGTWERNLLNDSAVWSRQQEALFQVAPGEFDGTHAFFMNFVHPEDRQRLEQITRRAIEEHLPYTSEYRVVLRDGSVRWMVGRGDVVRDAQGNPTHLVGVTMDVTQRKVAEAERDELLLRERSARARAEAANSQKDSFLAMLSHELRTPLTPVLMAAASMASDPSLSPEMRTELGMMRQNVEIQARLIDDLLDLTRLGRGKIKLEFQIINAHEAIAHAAQIARGDMTAKGLNLDLDLSATWPHIHADPARLQQVLWNLVRNSMKFTPEGGHIAIRTRNPSHGILEIRVIDTGIGIDPQVLPRVFDAFEQGDEGNNRRFGGLGLGLTISKALVELHGGGLIAQSDGPGHGAAFTIRLACAASPAHPAQAVSLAPAEAVPLRILLVEDHASTARVITRLLGEVGHHVHAVGSINSARLAFSGQKFDLLISDVGLPDGSGLDLMREIAAERPIPGIAISGYGMEQDIQASLAAGFAMHLTKPLELEKLLEGIHLAISRGDRPAPRLAEVQEQAAARGSS